jgi:hypothetical protein
MERDHRIAGFSREVSVYLSPATFYICFTPEARFV